jgi:hypothetical protein
MSPNASPPRDKQSLGYILRSGIAGGVAGCVVRLLAPAVKLSRCSADCTHTHTLGQDRRRTVRQSQDPLSSLQPGLPEVCRELERGVSRRFRDLQGGWRVGSLPRSLCDVDQGISLRCDQVHGIRPGPPCEFVFCARRGSGGLTWARVIRCVGADADSRGRDEFEEVCCRSHLW